MRISRMRGIEKVRIQRVQVQSKIDMYQIQRIIYGFIHEIMVELDKVLYSRRWAVAK